jgi:diaminohydroxyphosphoribosylaminopyrimidine deaminase / 5-amino-6-(5-phosphoribosylamino)uracil reductase
MMTSHETYMHRCLQLARLGAGHVAPNPMVGAVLVYQDRIIGEGYHQQFGGPHAEVNCIAAVSEEDKALITQSTIYVSLEPCAHFGKTGPCAELIINHKIPRVVIGCRDTFEAVKGKGVEKLRAAGIDVVEGILEQESKEINHRFFHFHQTQKPYIILKWSQSANNKLSGIGTERVFISNEMTNRLVHKWRSEEAGILVGTKTAMLDDPELNNRLWHGPSPIRMVVDLNLRLPASLKLFNQQEKTIVFNLHKQDIDQNIRYHKLESPENLIAQLTEALFQLNIQSVIIEGGAMILQSFIDAGFWNEARVITNLELLIEKGVDAPLLKSFIKTGEESMLNDRISYFKNQLA